MNHLRRKALLASATAAPLLLGTLLSGIAAPAYADVKTGVDAWAQGDYSKAVQEWTPLAQRGDADAQFNLGQAYKLGRGVPVNLDTALDWYRKAAVQGHSRAEDNYGLLLFQQNRRVEAMPYVQRSAERGEPRAQYLYGIAMFNGDLAAKDWVKAYAMMTRAAKSDLPQATASLTQMNQYIPQEQRLKGIAMAEQLEKQEQTTKLAAAPNAVTAPTAQSTSRPPENPMPAKTPSLARTAPAVTAPKIEAPKIAAAKPAPTTKEATAPHPKAASKPAPKPAAKPETAKAAPSGKWQVQIGAFSERGGAERMWKTLSAKVPGLSSYPRQLEKSGAVTRLLATSIASRNDAVQLCGKIKAAGGDCIVKAP